MAADRVEDHSVRIHRGLDAFRGLERRKIELARFSCLAVVGEAPAEGWDYRDAMCAAGIALDLADDRATDAIDHGHPVPVRDVHPVRAGIEHHVVPAVRRTERHRARDLVGWRLSERRYHQTGGDQRDAGISPHWF